MIIARTETVAKASASERKEAYGVSVFPDAKGRTVWLVGTPKALKKFGVLDPITPVLESADAKHLSG